jgi:hypothetical protein
LQIKTQEQKLPARKQDQKDWEWWCQVRRNFSCMDFTEFCAILRDFGEDADLLLVALESHEELPAAYERQFEESVRQRLELLIHAPGPHHELDIPVPAHVDREYAQAILTYGYIQPGQGQSFVGSNWIADDDVRANVQRKLMEAFDLQAYNQTFHFLRASGALLISTKAGKRAASSLKVHENDPRLTSIGREIVLQCKRRLYEMTAH